MPKQVDHELQRQSISQAALSVIAAQGLEAARLRDVAEAAGVTTGAVTHYFDGKDAMLEAALDEIVRQMIAEMDAAWDGPTQDVGAFIDSAAQFLPIDAEGLQGWRIWFAFWGRAIVDERLRAKHRAYYATFAARTDEALRAAFPGLTRATARSLADAIIAAIDGLGVRATLEPDAWPPKRQRAALRLLLDPMLTHATRGE